MNKAVVGALGAVIVIACGWLALGAAAEHAGRGRAASAAAVRKGSLGTEAPSRATRSAESSQREKAESATSVRPTDSDDARKDVSRAVNASVVDALGDAKMRLRDQAAERALAAQTPLQPPNGPELPTPEELKKIREIRRAYGDHDQDEMENNQ